VSHERTHAQFFSQGEGLAVVGFGQRALRRLAPRRNVAEEAQGIRLVAPFLVRTGKRQCTLGEGMRLFQITSPPAVSSARARWAAAIAWSCSPTWLK
jgi:hypothetical protein